MTMLDLIDGLVELLRGQEMEGVGPLPVEKYRRPDTADRLIISVTPVAQSERPVAIGGQFAEQFKVEVRCEVPWTEPRADLADAMLRAVDRILAVLEANREIGQAKRGEIGEVAYEVSHSRAGSHVLTARIPLVYSAEKKTG